MTDAFLIKDTPTLMETNLPVFSQIELSIQQMNNVYIPAIVFENLRSEEWDYDDLYDVRCILYQTLKEMGELDILETKKNYAVALYTNFFDAYTSLEFLLDNNTFKEIGKVNFILRWYKQEDEINVSKNFKRKIQVFMPTQKIFEAQTQNIRSNYKFSDQSPIISNLSNSYSPNINYLNPNRIDMFNNPFNNNHNSNSLNNSIKSNNSQNNSMHSIHGHLTISPQIVYNNVNISEFNQNINNFAINQINNNSSLINNFSNNNVFIPSHETIPLPGKKKTSLALDKKPPAEKVSTEKYTCKYEIQIENNNDFQVAKKLIGCNGCNMKNIVETCKNNCILTISEAVKLRLRGRGSGYREGPEMKESEESLHLCVSSKYLDLFNLACKLVEDLLTQLYDDYKKYTDKKGLFISKLELKRIEGLNNLVNNSTFSLNNPNTKKSLVKQKIK